MPYGLFTDIIEHSVYSSTLDLDLNLERVKNNKRTNLCLLNNVKHNIQTHLV